MAEGTPPEDHSPENLQIEGWETIILDTYNWKEQIENDIRSFVEVHLNGEELPSRNIIYLIKEPGEGEPLIGIIPLNFRSTIEGELVKSSINAYMEILNSLGFVEYQMKDKKIINTRVTSNHPRLKFFTGGLIVPGKGLNFKVVAAGIPPISFIDFKNVLKEVSVQANPFIGLIGKQQIASYLVGSLSRLFGVIKSITYNTKNNESSADNIEEFVNEIIGHINNQFSSAKES